MAPCHLIPARDDQSRPPLLTTEEWRAIVRTLALSPRQAQVVGLAIQSKKDKEIAITLRIGKTTVRKHITTCMKRLAVADRMGLAYRVFETFRQLMEQPPHGHK